MTSADGAVTGPAALILMSAVGPGHCNSTLKAGCRGLEIQTTNKNVVRYPGTYSVLGGLETPSTNEQAILEVCLSRMPDLRSDQYAGNMPHQ